MKPARAKDVNQVHDRMLILADVGEKSLHEIRAEVRELLADTMPADKFAALADTLTLGTWTHDHPIGFKQAQGLGLPAHGGLPAEFYKVMALVPQPTQRQPSVQYIPTPYGPRQRARMPKPESAWRTHARWVSVHLRTLKSMM